jgi:putative aldouronate transport system substrate-binding protein
MILATTSACGSKKDEASNPSTSDPSGTAVTEGSTDQKIDIWGKYSPEIEITTVKSITPDVAAIKVPEGQTWDNNPWSETYLKDFGNKYKVTWAVPQTQYEQKLGVAIASNQLPDITAVNAVQLKKIIDSDMATDMTQIYQDYVSPASRIFIEGDGGMALKQSTFDGKLMALPLSQGNSDHPDKKHSRMI